MQLSEFKQGLGQHAEKNLIFLLPTGTRIPLHAHVTDVARIEKRSIDCGGTTRTESYCRLQAWFSDDTGHRIAAHTLLKVLEKAGGVLGAEDLEVDLEYEAPFISQFPVTTVEPDGGNLVIHLGIRHTACRAQEVCIAPGASEKPLSFKSLPRLETVKCC
jgi:hypothetical protein